MKDQAKEKVKKLVERFRYNLDAYKKPTYNETQVRQEFINPFFEALGGDVYAKYVRIYHVTCHDIDGGKLYESL